MELQQTTPIGPPIFGQVDNEGGDPPLTIDAVIVAGQKMARQIPRGLAIDEPDSGFTGNRPEHLKRIRMIERFDHPIKQKASSRTGGGIIGNDQRIEQELKSIPRSFMDLSG
jgi:hypothetical protein